MKICSDTFEILASNFNSFIDSIEKSIKADFVEVDDKLGKKTRHIDVFTRYKTPTREFLSEIQKENNFRGEEDLKIILSEHGFGYNDVGSLQVTTYTIFPQLENVWMFKIEYFGNYKRDESVSESKFFGLLSEDKKITVIDSKSYSIEPFRPSSIDDGTYVFSHSFNDFINQVKNSNFLGINLKDESKPSLGLEEFRISEKLEIMGDLIDDYILGCQNYMEELKLKVEKEVRDFDKNNNGIVDIIESNDFYTLVNKYQKIITKKDKDYLHKFIRLSNYIKQRKENIQSIYDSTINEDSILTKEVLLGVLGNVIHNYQQITFHSINMVISLKDDDLITFYEIYESFDKLNIFNSNWENELSDSIKKVSEQIQELIEEIQKMEISITEEIKNLSYITQDSFSDLKSSVNSELKSINSSLKLNNLLTGIQTYQMYKINKNTKSLRS